VKHQTKNPLQKLSESVCLYKKVLVECNNPSLIAFVLSKIKERVVIEVPSSLFDDVFSSFPNFVGGVVGIPFVEKEMKNKSFLFSSYHQQTLKRTQHFVSSAWKDVAYCVVDQKSLKEPLFDPLPPKKITLSCLEDGFDDLLFFLKNNDYLFCETLEKEGCCVVRGFIVDVWGFGQKNIFRYNFYPNDSFYLVDSQTQEIIKSEQSFTLFSGCKNPKKSLFSLLSCRDIFVKVSNSSMLIKNKKGEKTSFVFDVSFNSFNYFDFKKVSASLQKQPSRFLLSSACFCGGFLFYPQWFVDKKEVFSTPLKKEGVLSVEVGNFYVHDLFGICCFLGFEETGSQSEERLCLKFCDGILKLGPKKLSLLSFYASKNNKDVVLNSLNKKGVWARRKDQALLSAQKYILSSYKSFSKRSSAFRKPYVFDESLFSLFVSFFKYKETADQSLAWKFVLKNLLSKKPMDRLLCGDVGFGKTEVALRAAFLAYCSNRSVVVLAPTTLLSQQLFNCFNERFSPFGAIIKEISRLSKNNKKTICDFNNKKIDVLVGTHAIIKSKNPVQNVDMYIVDEEHRFGVKDKESLLIQNPSVDFLYMSATPIPRSLQLSLSGIRSISTMLTPPSLRKSIITNVVRFNKKLFIKFILEEISRGGQVYVVDNSVKNVKFLFSLVSSMLPQVSAALIYGGLHKKEINSTMSLFRLKKISVLVSTSIIESGIDVSSANTIIINNSHLFGLAQLYQMRGRVGRAEKQAFAYLFVPQNKVLSNEASLRLNSLIKHSSLGSGYQISINDLEIRGSGDLFGLKQTGLSSVGFHFYSKLLALAAEKNNLIKPTPKFPFVSLGNDFISRSYIKSDKERLEVYSGLDFCFSKEELKKLKFSIESRFGPMPKESLNLFKAKSFSFFLKNKNVFSVVVKNGFLILDFIYIEGCDFSKFLNDFGGFLTRQGFNFTYIKKAGSFGVSVELKSLCPYSFVKKIFGFLYG